ncbi:MAG: type II toxin-antitoxin system RelE/ParE family toxin [Saprospiraceae bacterium]
MKKLFEVVFMEDARRFLQQQDEKTRKKIIFKIDLATYTRSSSNFKKLKNEIWEFRIRVERRQIRVLAFWDKRDKKRTLVIATHGFFKDQQKTPEKELSRAIRLRKVYFDQHK